MSDAITPYRLRRVLIIIWINK